MTQPEIWMYEDYRQFVQDWYHFKKGQGAKFSYLWFARRAGIAKGHLLRILNRSRNISEGRIEQLGKACQLEGTGLTYFFLLVLLNQSVADVSREVYRRELAALRQKLIDGTAHKSSMAA